jgi:NTE family protein
MPDKRSTGPASAEPSRTAVGFELALVLSGGNALGSYQAGAYQALHARGLEPDWVAGASAGAINGAVVCGNAPDRRIEQLQALWTPARDGIDDPSYALVEEARRTGAAAAAVTTGRPGLFVPRNLFGPWWNPFANPEPSSLYDATPMEGTLERLIDFDLLNRGAPRFSAAAVDVETGEDVVFDTRTHRIGPDHIRASAALLPAFSPVEIGSRLLGDAGISANLPLDSVLSEVPDRPLLCIAVDLLPLRGARPRTLGDTVARMQDLNFATQSRRAIAAWQAIFEARARTGDAASVTILHLAYWDQAMEVSGKAFDFSPETAARRWKSGHADVSAALAELDAGAIAIGAPGLSVYTRTGPAPLEKVHWSLKPASG